MGGEEIWGCRGAPGHEAADVKPQCWVWNEATLPPGGQEPRCVVQTRRISASPLPTPQPRREASGFSAEWAEAVESRAPF